jgi:low affinity Fe/Cu permease
LFSLREEYGTTNIMSRLDRTKKELEKGAVKATRWIGSTSSIIVHSIIFIICFSLPFFSVDLERVLLVLTTAVSLEAIYLAIFIQMTVNKNTEDIEDIQEDVEDIQKDVDEIQEDIEEERNEEELIEHKEANALSAIQNILTSLQKEIEQMKKK